MKKVFDGKGKMSKKRKKRRNKWLGEMEKGEMRDDEMGGGGGYGPSGGKSTIDNIANKQNLKSRSTRNTDSLSRIVAPPFSKVQMLPFLPPPLPPLILGLRPREI